MLVFSNNCNNHFHYLSHLNQFKQTDSLNHVTIQDQSVSQLVYLQVTYS